MNSIIKLLVVLVVVVVMIILYKINKLHKQLLNNDEWEIISRVKEYNGRSYIAWYVTLYNPTFKVKTKIEEDKWNEIQKIKIINAKHEIIDIREESNSN